MWQLIVGLLVVRLLLTFLSQNITERLRIHGSWDLRGVPPNPYFSWISPWNIGTSFPIRNRRLVSLQ